MKKNKVDGHQNLKKYYGRLYMNRCYQDNKITGQEDQEYG